MGKISNSTNNKGFTLVEVLLLIVVIVLVGGLGYLGYKQVNKKSTTSTSTTTATTTKTTAVDPYAGWKTGTLKYEKLSFKYPSNWTLADDSKPYSSSPEDLRCLKPGWDLATLTSPNGSKVTMGGPRLSCGGGGGDSGQLSLSGHESIKFAGSDIFILYPGPDVSEAILSETATPTSYELFYRGGVTTKNISSDFQPGVPVYYQYTYYNANDNSYAAMQADSDLALAKKIFESTSY